MFEKVKKFSQKYSAEMDNFKTITKKLNEGLRAQDRYKGWIPFLS